ncbi:MAG TPA: TIGR03086 family metal-binding protein [Acidimicrobiia bacterium]|nr:TIGR03086 family metal-binding protein [Acidimicrobiia bacterium]
MTQMDLLQRAIDQTGRIVAGVKPEQLGDPTPCTNWDVTALLNHTIGAVQLFERSVQGEELDFSILGQDLVGDDAGAAYEERARKLRAILSAPDVLDHDWNMPFGKVPAEQGLAGAAMEITQHGWDIARATGQDIDFDPDVTEFVFETARGIPDEFVRNEFVFGPKVAPAADAPLADQLAAYLGRQI